MSRFDEICDAYRKSRRAFLDYERVCQDFARDLVQGMVEYFEWPRNHEINYIPLGEDLDPNNKFYALAGAMRMNEESFWHFGVELTVFESGTSYPVSFVLSFFIKKVGPFFVVKLGPKGREIKIPEEQRHALEPFYEAVFRQIVEFFARKYQQAITPKADQELEFITITSMTE